MQRYGYTSGGMELMNLKRQELRLYSGRRFTIDSKTTTRGAERQFEYVHILGSDPCSTLKFFFQVLMWIILKVRMLFVDKVEFHFKL